MAFRNEFTIEITCNQCGSKKVEADLHMIQATGLLGIACYGCSNDPNLYDDDDLAETVNRHLPLGVRLISPSEKSEIEDKVNELMGEED